MSNSTLPFRIVPYDDESGPGFCLRLAQANGFTLLNLKKLLGLGENAFIAQSSANRLAHLCQVDVAIFQKVLPHKPGGQWGTNVHYRGHRFRVRSALCFRRPRYCPVCVAESGYFKAVWDFSLAVFCPQHRCALTCECTACSTVLGWDRTALDWCRCGQPLASSSPIPVNNKKQLALQTLFSNLLLGVSHKDETAQLGLPDWLVDLSLDGWFHLLSALGCADRSPYTPPKAWFTRSPTTSEAEQRLTRGFERLMETLSGEQVSMPFARLAIEGPLLFLMADPSGPVDRIIFRRLYTQIFGPDALEKRFQQLPDYEQLPLFESTS